MCTGEVLCNAALPKRNSTQLPVGPQSSTALGVLLLSFDRTEHAPRTQPIRKLKARYDKIERLVQKATPTPIDWPGS